MRGHPVHSLFLYCFIYFLLRKYKEVIKFQNRILYKHVEVSVPCPFVNSLIATIEKGEEKKEHISDVLLLVC